MDIELFTKITLGVTVIFIVGFLYIIFESATSPTFSLVKSEWQCTASHTHLRPQPTGKTVMIVQENVCDKYERVK
jgi:hypothetical protein